MKKAVNLMNNHTTTKKYCQDLRIVKRAEKKKRNRLLTGSTNSNIWQSGKLCYMYIEVYKET